MDNFVRPKNERHSGGDGREQKGAEPPEPGFFETESAERYGYVCTSTQAPASISHRAGSIDRSDAIFRDCNVARKGGLAGPIDAGAAANDYVVDFLGPGVQRFGRSLEPGLAVETAFRRGSGAAMKICVHALAGTSLLAILVLSLVPGTLRPHTMILPPGFEHVIAYAIAAFFLGLACRHRVSPVQLVVLLTAYGALLELGQLWVPGRHGQLSDIGADLAGASIGVMLASATMRLRSLALPR